MDGFSGEVLSRLPLADAVWSLLSLAIEAEFLDQIFISIEEGVTGKC